MTASHQLAQFVLNAAARGIPFSFDQLWLGAFNTSPLGGDPAGEVTAASYQRVLLSFAAPSGTDKTISAGTVAFPIAEESWGVINVLGLCTTADKGTGLVVVSNPLSGTPTIGVNQVLQIALVSLQVD